LHRFVYALGIRHAGEHVANVLADHFKNLEKLMSATVEDLQAIEGIGPVVADSLANFFKREENRKIIDRILNSGVKILEKTDTREASLAGKVFVLTGTLETLTRSDAKNMIGKAGGKVAGSVSRNTDFLVVGASPGSKLSRAQELGVTVIDEAALIRLTIINSRG
ncbi:MAG: NAD-dependent DNA ligase LigA, partial [Proteobacteria bacterium]|nr:NAD-dependent DNA ligase LigA [Pseudomonadota bacterium]